MAERPGRIEDGRLGVSDGPRAGHALAIAESLEEIAAIRGPRPVTPEELSLAVASLTRGYAKNFETGDQLVRAATVLL